jgi:hypothetical protein
MTPCEDTNFRTNHPLPNHFGEGKGYAGKAKTIKTENVCSKSVHTLASVVPVGSISESVLQEMPLYLMQSTCLLVGIKLGPQHSPKLFAMRYAESCS